MITQDGYAAGALAVKELNSNLTFEIDCYILLFGAGDGRKSKFEVDVANYKTIEVDVWTPNSGHTGYVYIDAVQTETFNNSTVKTLTYDVSNASLFEIYPMVSTGFQVIIERIKMY